MGHRTSKWKPSILAILAAVSLALFVVFLYTWDLGPSHEDLIGGKAGIPLWKDIRVASLPESFSVFNQVPYSGSILGVDGAPNLPEVSGFNFPGIYYRSILYKNGTVWRTFTLSKVYPAILAATLPLIWIACRCSERAKAPTNPRQD